MRKINTKEFVCEEKEKETCSFKYDEILTQIKKEKNLANIYYFTMEVSRNTEEQGGVGIRLKENLTHNF